MRIAGTQEFGVEPERAYAMLVDPARLRACIPGCRSLEPLTEDRFEVELSVPVPAVSGEYEGTVEILDRRPPSSFRLRVEAKASNGFVSADARMHLEPAGGGTRVRYEADAEVGGTPAAAGQRVLTGITRHQIGQLLGCMEAGRPVGLLARLRAFLRRLFGRRDDRGARA